MSRYLIRRLLFFIPTLIAISLLAFVINVQAPGDPVDRLFIQADNQPEAVRGSLRDVSNQMRRELGLHLPVFYVSIKSIAYPVQKPLFLNEQEAGAYFRLLQSSGRHDWVSDYLAAVYQMQDTHRMLEKQIKSNFIQDSLLQAFQRAGAQINLLPVQYDAGVIHNIFTSLTTLYGSNQAFSEALRQTDKAYRAFQKVEASPYGWRNLIPAVRIHPDNQYHRWLFGDGNWLTGQGAQQTRGVIRGDFGKSYVTQLPVMDIIRSRIGWSLFFTVSSVLLAYLISIPIGLRAASRRESLFDRGSSFVLFLLFSLPSFWVATLLLMNFANPDVWKLFPSSGVAPTTGFPDTYNLLQRLWFTLPYLVLPTICYTYAQLAFLSRLTRTGVVQIYRQDFIRTARAKGLPEKRVLYVHAFRNALLPLITVFANVFPAAIGGSVILETVFTLPGLGREIVQAIYQQDYPVVVCVFTLTGVLTLLAYLLADMAYALADPRINLKA